MKEKGKIFILGKELLSRHKLKNLIDDNKYEMKIFKKYSDLTKDLNPGNTDLLILESRGSIDEDHDIIKRIKEKKRSQLIPLIYIAGSGLRANINKLLDHRIEGILHNPINKNELNILMEALIRFKIEYFKLNEKFRKATKWARVDGLTGICNYIYFQECMIREISRSERYKHSTSVILSDIDYFKNYNDTHGHLKGNVILKKIARIFSSTTRKMDIPARYGGDEFVVILPQTGKYSALIVANRLKKAIELFPFPNKETQPEGKITITMGVATFPDDARNVVELIAMADKLLYRGKNYGRNSIVYLRGSEQKVYIEDTGKS